MIVYKFGGALARSKRGLEALVEILREASKREAIRARRKSKSGASHGVILVTSAIGHTTRHLARAAELAEEGRLSGAEEILARTIAQHEQLAALLHLEEETRLFDRFEEIAGEINGWLEGVAIVRELSPRTRDAILASGERLAAALIEALLKARGLPVRWVPAGSVIITDEQFGFARPNVEEITRRAEKHIVPQLRRSHIVLIEGFAGATLDGITTTMGSESSDLTATLLAGVLDAEEVIIWKVLPGLYTADPELVKNPKLIRSLSFVEAEELGRRGARVLFQSFAHPLMEGDTVLRVATPFGHFARHTILQREAPATRRTIPLALVTESRLVKVTITNANNTTKSPARKGELPVEAAVRKAVLSWNSGNEVHALMRKEDWRAAQRTLASAALNFTESGPFTAISLVVRRVNNGDAAAIVAAMARSLRTFPVHGIFEFERSLITLVDDAHAMAALRKLHHDLFEG